MLDREYDGRTNCISIITKIKLKDYAQIVKKAFENNGNIEGQRGVISRSSSAVRIRDRMNKDFIAGAIFPPVVLGLMTETDKYEELRGLEKEGLADKLLEFIAEKEYSNVSIVDGMQRSNVYLNHIKGNEDREIRVEIWVSPNVVKLLYRMLILNTGQVPWNVRRQIEVVYSPLVNTLEAKLFEEYPELNGNVNLFDVNSNGKRTAAGEYHKNQIVELYLSFNLRTEKVDVQTQLAEDFHKIDMVESLEKEDGFDVFIRVFANLCKLDLTFGEFLELTEVKGRFFDGKGFFSSHPARVGFIVAATQLIIGKIMRDKEKPERDKAIVLFEENCLRLIQKIDSLSGDPEALKRFFAFDYLDEYLMTLPKSKVGDVERKGFTNCMTEILAEKDEYVSLEPYWRAF